MFFSGCSLTELEVRKDNRLDVILLGQEDAVGIEIDILPFVVNPRRIIKVEQPLLRVVRVLQGPPEQPPAIGKCDLHVASLIDKDVDPCAVSRRPVRKSHPP